ncbi:hypothetical protein ACFLWZ_02645 [Chloroflexota bacterium]
MILIVDTRTAIIIFVFLLLLVVLAITLFRKHRGRAKLKPFASILEERVERLQYLEKSMDRLFKEHQVIGKLSDAYNLITKYASCRDKTEEEYCRNYLRNIYSSGYMRYDDERT